MTKLERRIGLAVQKVARRVSNLLLRSGFAQTKHGKLVMERLEANALNIHCKDLAALARLVIAMPPQEKAHDVLSIWHKLVRSADGHKSAVSGHLMAGIKEARELTDGKQLAKGISSADEVFRMIRCLNALVAIFLGQEIVVALKAELCIREKNKSAEPCGAQFERYAEGVGNNVRGFLCVTRELTKLLSAKVSIGGLFKLWQLIGKLTQFLARALVNLLLAETCLEVADLEDAALCLKLRHQLRISVKHAEEAEGIALSESIFAICTKLSAIA